MPKDVRAQGRASERRRWRHSVSQAQAQAMPSFNTCLISPSSSQSRERLVSLLGGWWIDHRHRCSNEHL